MRLRELLASFGKKFLFPNLFVIIVFGEIFKNFQISVLVVLHFTVETFQGTTRDQNLRDHLFLFSPKSKSFSQTIVALLWRKSKVTYGSYQ